MDIVINLAIALRAILMIYGHWQDTHLAVKYTDIDYEVYTDAAQFMVAGGSPYDRSTYRYSPLLAALLTPNILLHKSFGKILFCIADIVAAKLMLRLLHRRRASSAVASLGVAIWLFSPFTVSISTRGNGEALVTCMLLGMLDLLESGWLKSSALLYGLSVHWRIYPILYSLPLMRYLALNAPKTKSVRQKLTFSYRIKSSFSSLISTNGIIFALISGSFFLVLCVGLYHLYGYPFLHETYLYHATRIDPRHNFSPYFYPAYLGTEIGSSDGGVLGDSGRQVLIRKDGCSFVNEVLLMNKCCFSSSIYRIFSIAGLILQIAIGWSCADNLPAALMLQTVALVAFNKVATAQYFVWYLSWLPLVLPQLIKAENKRALLLTTLLWAASLGHWLFWAYQLEFKGKPVHAVVWAAGLLWVVANALLLRLIIFALRKNKNRKSKGM